jgi:hypothetical protein
LILKAGSSLYELATPDETIETIGDITPKDSAVTTIITNADYTGFEPPKLPPTTRMGCPPPGRSVFGALCGVEMNCLTNT